MRCRTMCSVCVVCVLSCGTWGGCRGHGRLSARSPSLVCLPPPLPPSYSLPVSGLHSVSEPAACLSGAVIEGRLYLRSRALKGTTWIPKGPPSLETSTSFTMSLWDNDGWGGGERVKPYTGKTTGSKEGGRNHNKRSRQKWIKKTRLSEALGMNVTPGLLPTSQVTETHHSEPRSKECQGRFPVILCVHIIYISIHIFLNLQMVFQISIFPPDII